MTPSIEEQVKVLRSVGVSDSEISKTLGIDLKEIDKPVEKPKEEPKSSGKTPPNAYTKEEFEEAKRLSSEGKTNIAIAMAQDRSAGFIGKALQCETFEDLLKMRKRDTERKREYNENKAIQKQANADRRRERQRNYEAAKRETKRLENAMIQAALANPDVFTEISKQLTRIADVLEAMPKKRRFFKR